jgi:hypothetical protein
MKLKLFLTLILLVLLGNWSCHTRGENETFLLPKDFTGMVIVLFNQKDGQPPKYENRRRVYEIPKDGILRTQFPFNEGWHDSSRYFYVNGNKVEIPFVLEHAKLSSDAVQVCCITSGQSARTLEDPWVEYEQFYVGTKSQIHDASLKREKINPADLIKR